MKIIFLDIDGVLNSKTFDAERNGNEENIDITRFALLRELIEKTGAKIVLSSSWRKHWDKDYDKCDDKGKKIADTFRDAGVEIYDKTPVLGYLKRYDEIKAWLNDHPDVVKFVIFDDYSFGWNDFTDKLVKTNERIGRGLGEEHIRKAVELLS